MSEFTSPLRLRLDGDVLVSNWKAMAAQAAGASVGAAVKADGYGLGAREVVKRLAKAGCRDFFVAHWGEAEAIADIVPPSQIAVLNGATADDIVAARALGAIPVLNTPHQIMDWKASGGGMCHVMLDSGINRLGIGLDQLHDGLLDGLNIDILLSHLASADENVPQNDAQLRLFITGARSIKSKRKSLANSAGIMLGSEYHFDLCRPGLSLYGGIARPEMSDFIKQVVTPQARIIQIHDHRVGQAIGYNATYICPNDMRIATAAIGYADGYLRGFSGKGSATFNAENLPIIGRVSMDLITLDASHASELTEGDYIDIQYDLPNASKISGLSQYELLTGLSKRAERIWV